MLKLKLFGPGQAHYFDQPLMGFPAQQCCSLLCYLLLNRHYPHPREKLAAVFWGDYPTETSRKYLRNALWKLRQTLHLANAPIDEYLLVSDESVSFLTSSRYWLDVEIFEATLARYHSISGQDLTSEQAAQLEAGVDLYTGHLLEGVYEDWCLPERERLHLLHLDALSKLVTFHEINGSYERGLIHGERILSYDNTREKVHRQMMRLYWLLGNRTAALAQYKRCIQILREELGVGPLEETELLYQQIVNNQLRVVDWPEHRDVLSVTKDQIDEPFQLLVEHVLQKLRRLEAIVDVTSVELHHIEHLISSALVDSKRS